MKKGKRKGGSREQRKGEKEQCMGRRWYEK
jgi:hypothetical protein